MRAQQQRRVERLEQIVDRAGLDAADHAASRSSSAEIMITGTSACSGAAFQPAQHLIARDVPASSDRAGSDRNPRSRPCPAQPGSPSASATVWPARTSWRPSSSRLDGLSSTTRMRPRTFAPTGPEFTVRIARTADHAADAGMGLQPRAFRGSPRKSTSASMRLSMASAATQQLVEIGEQHVVAAGRGVLHQHLAIALDGVDRRAQVVAQLGLVEDHRVVAVLLRQHRSAAAHAAPCRRCGCGRDRRGKRRARAFGRPRSGFRCSR